MDSLEIKSAEDLETAAAEIVGRIVLILSRLEFNVSLYLRNAAGGVDPEGAGPLISRLSFKNKVDALSEVVAHKFLLQPSASAELASWLRNMERFRVRRNSFVHGRWAFLGATQQIVNVAPGMPNGKPQKEARYSAEELNQELRVAQDLARGFAEWSEKWPL